MIPMVKSDNFMVSLTYHVNRQSKDNLIAKQHFTTELIKRHKQNQEEDNKQNNIADYNTA